MNAQPQAAARATRRRRPDPAANGLDRAAAGPAQSKIWATGNLRGRAGGYRRGTLSLAGVSGAIRVALSSHLSLQEIQSILDEYDLGWEPLADQTIDRRLTMN